MHPPVCDQDRSLPEQSLTSVYKNGSICLDTLQDKWTAGTKVQFILVSIQSLLSDPNTSSPANSEAAKILETNKELYYQKVRECVENSWEDELFNGLLEEDAETANDPKGSQVHNQDAPTQMIPE